MQKRAKVSNGQNKIPFSWKKSLRFRLTVIVVLISLFWGIAVMASVSYIYQNRIDSEYINNTVRLTKAVASIMEGEKIDHYLATLERDDEYDRMLKALQILQRETGVLYIYVSRPAESGEVFVFDADEEDPFDLGDEEEWAEDDYGMGILDRLLRGERVEPNISTTRWGWLITAREPIYRADGSVAAYASIDASLDQLMEERGSVLLLLGIIVLAILLISFTGNLYTIQKIVISPVDMLVKGVSAYQPGERVPDFFARSKSKPVYEFRVLEGAIADMGSRIEDMLDELKKAEEQMALMLNTNPLCCQLWNCDLKIIDCSEAAVSLFGLKSKQEFIDKYFKFSPEFQPDGQRSDEKALMLVKTALEEGRSASGWMHQLPDGSPLPAEVTLVRVEYKDSFVVAEYTRDLSDITIMMNTITWLKKEAEKIYYDALTGIYNRRYLDEHLGQLIKTLSRSGSALSVLMIDIDFFKKYNDTYGHNEGDNCLRIVAETLSQSMVREDDFVARYGGEEFAVVLPNTDENGARVVSERLLANIQNRNIPHEKNESLGGCVTVSIGATTGKPVHTQSGEDYIKKADEMLYASKQNGRNRYTFGAL